ncbi:MAG: hypothetical protein JOZ69_06395, partial [Myxococcales bacterium]|nr:hypothetical protein [Myxococcales bacterium]
MTRSAEPPAPLASGAAWLVAISVAFLGVRVIAATRVGFGDAEALYASYALHPQPAYLDHPGLVGVVARTIGGGTAPAPGGAHLFTAALATLVPWAMVGAGRASGATWSRATAAALVFALAPEIAVGLFALTPDLLLALAWIGSLAAAAAALRAPPHSVRATAAFAAAGLLAGVGAVAKVTGLGLLAALGATYASRPAREHARGFAPWAGLAAGTLVVAPVALFEAHAGWPMLRHRLASTQAGAGLSWRNLGALAGGQFVYVSPLILLLAVSAARELWRRRGDAVGRLLLFACVLPLAGLLPLCLWSRVAEPHWIAPALLALVPAAARAPGGPSPRRIAAACALGGAMVAAVYAWVLVPSLVRFVPASAYDARLDLANELQGWPQVVRTIRAETDGLVPAAADARDLAVVGPHWVICAQLEAGLQGARAVGCDTPVADDFDGWLPRGVWRRAEVVVWVGDARFPDPPDLPHHTLRSRQTVSIV